jgi:hypothetical protein
MNRCPARGDRTIADTTHFADEINNSGDDIHHSADEIDNAASPCRSSHIASHRCRRQ